MTLYDRPCRKSWLSSNADCIPLIVILLKPNLPGNDGIDSSLINCIPELRDGQNSGRGKLGSDIVNPSNRDMPALRCRSSINNGPDFGEISEIYFIIISDHGDSIVIPTNRLTLCAVGRSK
jgi:hypothetical protein